MITRQAKTKTQYTRIHPRKLKELRNEIRGNEEIHKFIHKWTVLKGEKLASIYHAFSLENKFFSRGFNPFKCDSEEKMSIDYGPRLTDVVDQSKLVTLDEKEEIFMKSGTKDECQKKIIPGSLDALKAAREAYFELRTKCENLEETITKLTDIAKRLID